MERAETARAKGNWIGIVAGLPLLAVVTAGLYWPILFSRRDSALYPWASDTMGHVLKVEYLQAQMEAGERYPDLMPWWYMGLQVFRYHAPLPYYVLVPLAYLLGDAVAAANWFIAWCAFAGGAGMLLYRRWAGWWPALAGGLLYVFIPDNVRVALAEGNLPRAAAAALLPYIFYFLLRSLEPDGRPRHRLALAILFALVVLCHAMMAAIYAIGGAVVALLLWGTRCTRMRAVMLSLSAMVLGILLSGWWLLPSLTGGITEINASAMTEALAVFPLGTYLNPLLRLTDPEIVYPGAALMLISVSLVVVFAIRKGGRVLGVSLAAAGLLCVLISTPGFNAVYNALPGHHLAWPLRFVGMGSFLLLLGLMIQAGAWSRRHVALAGILFLVLVADNLLSLPLVHLRPAHPDVHAVAMGMAQEEGWREATLDQSRLGSEASYCFTALAGREQVYGWAYQGARTARNVAALNEAMLQGFDAYVIDRLNFYGVDDVVLSRTPDMSPGLAPALTQAGFAGRYQGADVEWFHRDGAPRAVRPSHTALGIGSGAQNLAYIFPQILLGTSDYLDDYVLDDLRAFETILLSGFQWHSKKTAEEMVSALASAGVNVVVDLTNTPTEVLAREPYFLGVWGELIILEPKAIEAHGEWGRQWLKPFGSDGQLWQASTPQGLDHVVLHHDYLGGSSNLVGYKNVGGGRVWFVGLNLPYHAVLTRDPTAIQVLAKVLGLEPGMGNSYAIVPAGDYQAAAWGFRFDYTLGEAAWVIFPAAFHDDTEVYIDGEPTACGSYESLVAFHAPAGRHEARIEVHPSRIYPLGKLCSAVALLALAGMAGWELRHAAGTGDV